MSCAKFEGRGLDAHSFSIYPCIERMERGYVIIIINTIEKNIYTIMKIIMMLEDPHQLEQIGQMQVQKDKQELIKL